MNPEPHDQVIQPRLRQDQNPPTLSDQLDLLRKRLEESEGRIRPELADLADALEEAATADRLNREAAERRNRQQLIVLRLAKEALASVELQPTLELLAREASSTLGVEFCSIVQDTGDGVTFIRHALRSTDPPPGGAFALSDAQAAYTLSASTTVVSPDLSTETRFKVPTSALGLGAVSGMSVLLPGHQKPWGIVGVHSKERHTFTPEDARFLEAVANLMALAIERERVQVALRQRNRQQAAVAALGRHALAGPHMEDFFRDATRAVAATLEVDLCDLLQRNGDQNTILLRAGVGWHAGLVGAARIHMAADSQAAFALHAEDPLIVTDLATDKRFDPSEHLKDHDVVSSLMVVIPGRHRPFGLLGAHSRTKRAFTQDDSFFLQAVANLLASAIERHGVEGELRRHRNDLEGLVDERTALLAASNRELEAFSYTISHDLRAPLRSINGFSKILERKYGAPMAPQAHELLRLMAEETVRMGTLIDAILAMSRLGSVTLARIPVNVSALAQEILENLQKSTPDRKVAWAVDPDVHVIGDRPLVRVLLENLLGNAWKFTSKTSDARISVLRSADGFLVEDNGAGFDMAHARELFQPFHRLHSADEFEGVGIGLATVSRIVGRHGGKIQAKGVRGKGATFHVTFPIAPFATSTVPRPDPFPRVS